MEVKLWTKRVKLLFWLMKIDEKVNANLFANRNESKSTHNHQKTTLPDVHPKPLIKIP